MKIIGFLTGIILLCSCASQQGSNNQVAQADPPGMICQREKVQGSIIPRRVCRSEEQIEAEKEAAAATMRDQRSAGSARGSFD